VPLTPAAAAGPRSRRTRETRERIVESALDLAAEDPTTRITAERIAERAGVSRRTFFNYFPSVEAAFFAPVQLLLRAAVEQLEQVPAEVPLLETLARAMNAAAEQEPLDRLGRCASLGSRLPQLQGSDLEQWEAADALLTEAFEERYPYLTAFEARCLTGAVIGTCRAALFEWQRGGQGRRGSASADELGALLQTALTRVATGFAPVVDRPHPHH
jgi:AcrR family transcriptional regulator